MNNTYIFHLGRERELSIAELQAVFKNAEVLITKGSLTLIQPKEDFESPQQTLNNLGGTIQISKITQELSLDSTTWAKPIADLLNTLKPEGKLSFGINYYGKKKVRLMPILKAIKNELKTHGRNSRFPNSEGNLTSATLRKGGLMKHKTHLNLIEWGDQILLSQTVATQNFEAYSLRDYDKPARLAKSGMLPPKLAQTMINLANLVPGYTQETNQWLYDPFCGSGTVLGEAMLKGLNVMGSDLAKQAVDAAEINLNWLANQEICRRKTEHVIFEHDAETLTEIPQNPDLVVSETYLGPPRAHLLNPDQVTAIHTTLMKLYRNFLESIHPLLNVGTPIVIGFPLHHTKKGPVPLPKLDKLLEKTGYKLHDRLTYRRENQVVGRDILIFERI